MFVTKAQPEHGQREWERMAMRPTQQISSETLQPLQLPPYAFASSPPHDDWEVHAACWACRMCRECREMRKHGTVARAHRTAFISTRYARSVPSRDQRTLTLRMLQESHAFLSLLDFWLSELACCVEG